MKIALTAAFFLLALALTQGDIGQGYDSQSPTVSITAPTAGQVFAAGTTSITLTYTGSDVGGSVAKYWVRIDSNSWIDNALNTSYNFTGLSAGNYTFSVIATDDSDNNSSTATVSASISSATSSCGNGVCDSGETTASCPADCVGGPTTCSSLGGRICASAEICSGTIVSASDTSACCIGTCVPKSCTELGGVTCDQNANDCTSWINQATSCCLASACTPKITTTILCSFRNYLENEPVTAVFIEPSALSSSYRFNVSGQTVTVTTGIDNKFAGTIVIQYPQLEAFLVSANLIDSPSMTPEQSYLLELLKQNSVYGTSAYSAKAESFQDVYALIDSSRLRWWNANADDTCEPKLSPSELGVSLQSLHYFRINNLWLLWSEISGKGSSSSAAGKASSGTKTTGKTTGKK